MKSCILFLLFFPALNPLFGEEANIIDINGGFETTASQVNPPYGRWNPYQGVPLTLTTEKKHSGDQSLVLKFPNGYVEGWVEPSLLTPGTELEISGYIFLTHALNIGERAAISIEVCDPDWKPRATASCEADIDPGEWHKVSSSLIVPDDFQSDWPVRITIIARAKDTESVSDNLVYFDDVQVSQPIASTPAPKK
jgi:hypothetical protein